MSRTHVSKSSHWTPPSVFRKSSSSFKPPTVGIKPGTGRWQSTEETAGWRAPLSSEVGKSYLSNSIQTKCDACEGKEKEETPEVQTKLTVGEPGDKYEQEADATAEKVVKQINSPGFNESVQRNVEPVAKPTVMRHGGVGGGGIDPGVEQSIQGERGSGQGLSEKIKEPMERAFGADFSGVKVHTDGNANQLNRSLHSRAFATGQDIFFKQGEYNPGSGEGQELIAHELTHVLQQSGRVQAKIQCQEEDDKSWLGQAWDSTKEIVDEYKLIERGMGALQVAGGVGEMVIGGLGVAAPEPATTAAGTVLFVHGADTASTGIKQIVTGESKKTLTHQGVAAGAELLGVNPKTADRIGLGTDIGVSIAGGLGVAKSLTSVGKYDDIANVAKGTKATGYSRGGPKLLPSPSATSAFESLGSLEGMSIIKARNLLKRNGFRFIGRSKGGYITFRRTIQQGTRGGSRGTTLQVTIRPNGEVIRSVRNTGQRFDAVGRQITEHTSGEFLGGNFSGP